MKSCAAGNASDCHVQWRQPVKGDEGMVLHNGKASACHVQAAQTVTPFLYISLFS